MSKTAVVMHQKVEKIEVDKNGRECVQHVVGTKLGGVEREMSSWRAPGQLLISSWAAPGSSWQPPAAPGSSWTAPEQLVDSLIPDVRDGPLGAHDGRDRPIQNRFRHGMKSRAAFQAIEFPGQGPGSILSRSEDVLSPLLVVDE